MAFTQVTLTGTVTLSNSTPANGAFVRLTLSAPITDGVQVVAPQTLLTTCNSSGQFSITVNANDDPTTLPLETYYEVVISDGPEILTSFDVVVPHADTTVDLFTLAQLPNPAPAGIPFVEQIVAGTDITISPTGGTGVVTINSTGGGGGAGLPSNFVSKTGNYTASANDFVEANASSAAFTVTLPTSPSVGALVAIKKTDGSTNAITIHPASGGSIDGATSATIANQNYGAVFSHTGSNVWEIVATPLGSSAIAGTAFDFAGTASASMTAHLAAINPHGDRLTPRASGPITSANSPYTIPAGELTPVDLSSGAVTLKLANAPADETIQGYKVVNLPSSGANALTVQTQGSDVFEVAGGSTSGVTSQPILGQTKQYLYENSSAIWYAQAADNPLAQLDTRYPQFAVGSSIYAKPAWMGSAWVAENPDMVDVCSEFGVAVATTDNSTALNSALSTLGPLGLKAFISKPGVYAVKNPVIIGNGSGSALSTWSAILVGVGRPNWVAMTQVGSPVSTSLRWTGSSGAGAIFEVLGPVQGWGLENILLDGGATIANAPTWGALLTSAQYGYMRNVAFQNSPNGLKTTTVAPFSSYVTDNMHNRYDNLQVTWVPIASAVGAGIMLTGAGSTSDTCYEQFENTSLVMPSSSVGKAQRGIYLQAADTNTFHNTHFGGTPTGSDVRNYLYFDFSVSGSFPSDNRIDGIDFSQNAATNTIAVTGTPSAPSNNQNRIANIATENGYPSYNNFSSVTHLIWDQPCVIMGSVSLVAGAATVTDSRIKQYDYAQVSILTTGGTPGILSANCATAGELIITSTSNTDTSNVCYRLFPIL